MTVHYIGVRHHSPAAAKNLRSLIEDVRPSHVLIEGPSDFNEQIHELALPHRTPIAIYTWAMGEDGQRRGAVYPFCEYSPEWQAASAGFETGADVRFIDLPWADVLDDMYAEHRYSDGPLRKNPYIEALCEELAVDEFDDAWDRLFEVDASIPRNVWFERARVLCRYMRESTEVPSRDLLRERFMASRIREVLTETERDVVVVTGGFHTSAVRDMVNDGCEDVPLKAHEFADGRGVCLMPYAYEVLDRLVGYNAGMPNPGFYDRVWNDRLSGAGDTFRGLLRELVVMLRDRNQLFSSADLIAVESTARALATLRGHSEPWRNDLLDGISAALVKEEIAGAAPAPIIEACNELLRGGAVGRLAEGTSVPSLVEEIRQRLEASGLTPTPAIRTVSFDLYESTDLERSQLLHALSLLGLHGFTQVSAPSAETATEKWTIVWTAEMERMMVERSAYGGSIEEACGALLMSKSEHAQADSGAAATLVRLACLAGIQSVRGALLRRLDTLLSTDADFVRVARATSELLSLFRYETVLATGGRADIGTLLQSAWERGLLLLGQLGVPSKAEPTAAGIATTLEVFERAGVELDLEAGSLLSPLSKVASDSEQLAQIRGAALGGLWVLGTNADEVERSVAAFATPGDLGDFLTGVFLTARELAQRNPALVAEIDAAIAGFSNEAFLVSLPALRLAFTALSPREKHGFLQRVFGEGQSVPRVETVDVQAVTQMMTFEAELFAQAGKFGIRPGRGWHHE